MIKINKVLILTILIMLFVTSMFSGCIDSPNPIITTLSSNPLDTTIQIANMGGSGHGESDGYTLQIMETGSYTIYLETTKQDRSRVNVNLYYTPQSSTVPDRFGGHASYERRVTRDLGWSDIYSTVNQTVAIRPGLNSVEIGAMCYNEPVCEVHIVVKKEE